VKESKTTVNTTRTANGARRSHTVPPDGLYNVTIIQVKAEPDPETASPALIWSLRIDDRPYHGTLTTFVSLLRTGSISQLKELLKALGVYEDGMAITTSPEDDVVIQPALAGMRARAVVKGGRTTELRAWDGVGGEPTSAISQRYDADELLVLDALWEQFDQTVQTWTGTSWHVYALGYRAHLPAYAAALTPDDYFARLAHHGATSTVCAQERGQYFSAATALAAHALWRSDGLGNARIVYDVVLDAPIYLFQSPDTGQVFVVTPEKHPGLDSTALRPVNAMGVEARRR
jgi:hypothetical protein